MKQTKKIFALLMSAIFALSMVPVQALAEEVGGRLGEQTGAITIKDVPVGETYHAWQILELASYKDMSDNLGADQHVNDAYAYVIKTNSPWLSFIRDYVHSDTNHLFTVGNSAIKLKDSTTDYYIVEPTDYFKNAFSNTASDNKDETTSSEWNSASIVQKFAQSAVAYAKDTSHIIATDASGTNSSTTTSQDVSLKTSGASPSPVLPLGYYVIDSTLGSLCMLDTTNNTITIEDKNDVHSIRKGVQEDSKADASDTDHKLSGFTSQEDSVLGVNDASIGDTVYYRTKIDVKKGAHNLVLHDKMDAGLTWQQDSVAVYLLGHFARETEDASSWTKLEASTVLTFENHSQSGHPTKTYGNSSGSLSDFYTVTKNESNAHYGIGSETPTVDTFDVAFNQSFLDYLSDMMDHDGANDRHLRLMVTYNAVLNERAVINDPSKNMNETYLEYGDGSKTPKMQTHTATWEFDLSKFTKDNAGQTEASLDGAQFQVKPKGGTTALKFINLGNGQYKYDGRSAIQNATLSAANTNMDTIKTGTATSPDDSQTQLTVVDTITTSNGKLSVIGLDGDDYVLTETVAPKGYNKLTSDINFHITDYDESVAAVANTDRTNVYFDNQTTPASHIATAGQVVLQGANLTDTADNTLATAVNKIVSDTNASLNIQIDVENHTGPELPSTGGMGTTIFYVVGGVLVAGAAILLVTKRRMGTEA